MCMWPIKSTLTNMGHKIHSPGWKSFVKSTHQSTLNSPLHWLCRSWYYVTELAQSKYCCHGWLYLGVVWKPSSSHADAKGYHSAYMRHLGVWQYICIVTIGGWKYSGDLTLWESSPGFREDPLPFFTVGNQTRSEHVAQLWSFLLCYHGKAGINTMPFAI